MNYKKLGFKAGLEIHQQLKGKKLFCNCPTEIIDGTPTLTFERKLRVSAGESGKLDVAAKAEMSKNKYYIYNFYKESNCEVDRDEEPPHSVNSEALQTALQIAKLMNCKIVDEIQFMRKIVVDGSNVSGFQRTALIGYDGWIETNYGKVAISGLFLEEEAAKKVETTEQYVKYNISRLGIPLLEIATGPDIKNPEHAKETAEKIGMILRSVKGMKRGIGSIRQDVNISIKNGERTEIKGFQDYKAIPKAIDWEINRQLELIKQNKPILKTVRKAEPDGTNKFLRPMPGSARMYPETDVPTIIPKLKNLKEIELIDDKIKRYIKEFKISNDLATLLAKSEKNEFLEELIRKNPKVKAAFIIETVLSKLKEMKRDGKEVEKITNEHLKEMFNKLNNSEISKDSIENILLDVLENKLDYSKYAQMSKEKLKEVLQKIVEQNPGVSMGVLMGKAMQELKGKAEGKLISQILKELTQSKVKK